MFDPVDDDGNFHSYMGFLAGMNIKDADKAIIRNLKENYKILRHETIEHSLSFLLADRHASHLQSHFHLVRQGGSNQRPDGEK